MAKKNFTNATHIEGYVYEHKLDVKTAGAASKNPGVEFINGTLSVATDEECLNIVQVHFTYVTAVTSKGKPNNTYNTLAAIINGSIKNVMEHGKENADRVRIDSALALNEWYDTRTQGNPLVSVKRNEGGFVHQLTIAETLNDDPDKRATFDVDMVITKATRVDADEEKNTPEKMTLKGYIFDFRGSLLPVDFTVLADGAMNYFERQDISEKNPFCTRLQGKQISQTVVHTKTEENAFGEAMIKETRSSQRDFVVTWATTNPYEWDSEEFLLATELAEKVTKRELDLADIKKRQDEYQATKGNAISATNTAPAATPKKDDYNF